jgi:hypothetical protein
MNRLEKLESDYEQALQEIVTLKQSVSGKNNTIERLQKINADLSMSMHKARKVIDVLLFPNGY